MLTALCLATVFAISLSSYIALCFMSVTLSTRSIAVAHSTELAETGVEQALYAMNNGDWSNWTQTGTTYSIAMSMTSSGLALTSAGKTPLNYGNGITGTVSIVVSNYASTNPLSVSPGPSIASTATMTLPKYKGSVAASTIVSVANYSASTSPLTAAEPVFVNAVASTTGVTKFKSAGTLDSYTSNPSSGTYQNYSSSVAGYSAVIASQDTTTTSASVVLGNAVVHGYAVGYNYSSPGTTNWLSYSASGKIVGPSTAAGTYIDSSRLVTSAMPYQPLEFESLPTNYTTLPAASTTDGSTINKTCVLGSTAATAPVVYDAGTGITLNNKILTIVGPVVIICYSDVTLTGSGQIVLATPQASLQIFLEYGNLNLGGNGITNMNATPLPKKVAIISTTNQWGTPTITTNMPYYGVIYLPYLAVAVSSPSPTIYGSIVGQSVTFTNSPTIHYDRALRSPTPTYTSSTPLQSGAAFDSLSTSAVFSGLVTTMQ